MLSTSGKVSRNLPEKADWRRLERAYLAAAEVAEVESMLERAKDDDARAYLGFALGKMHDDRGEYERAAYW